MENIFSICREMLIILTKIGSNIFSENLRSSLGTNMRSLRCEMKYLIVKIFFVHRWTVYDWTVKGGEFCLILDSTTAWQQEIIEGLEGGMCYQLSGHDVDNDACVEENGVDFNCDYKSGASAMSITRMQDPSATLPMNNVFVL